MMNQVKCMGRVPPDTLRLRAAARWLGLLLLCFALIVGCQQSDSGPLPAKPNVILITIDTLRADHLGLYGYERNTSPNIDRFFGSGLVVERAYSTEGNTSPSVASILTGLLPQQHGVRLLYQLVPEGVTLLPDFLPDGYETAAFVSNIVLTDEAIGLARAFDHYDDHVAQRVEIPGANLFERDAEATTDAALAWLATRADPKRPLLLWVHYIDPHSPYRPPKEYLDKFDHEGQRAANGGFISPSVKIDGVDDVLEYIDRYDAEIAFTDAQIGRLIDQIPKHTPVDETWWLLTADHGESMDDRLFWFSHGHNVHDEVVRVPLMIKGPSDWDAPAPALGSGVDIVPTILAIVGQPPLAASHGVDLRDQAATSPRRRIYAEAINPLAKMAGKKQREAQLKQVGFWRAVIEGNTKWIVGLPHGSPEILVRERYDLAADPLEQHGEEWTSEPGAAAALEALVAADPDPGGLPESLQKGIAPNAPKVAPRATQEQLERLRALGYVE